MARSGRGVRPIEHRDRSLGGRTHVIDFTTDEGTGMSVAVSPDGTWIAFDLLGHIYRMPIALNFHPASSPDGKQIAFTSDRNGQLNIWVMDAAGGHPRLVRGDPDTRYIQPTWDPDGKSVVAVRLSRTPGRSWHRQNRTLYRLPLGGGAPEPLVDEHLTQPDSPSFSPDGKYLYYHVSYSIAEGLGMLTAGHRILRREAAPAGSKTSGSRARRSPRRRFAPRSSWVATPPASAKNLGRLSRDRFAR